MPTTRGTIIVILVVTISAAAAAAPAKATPGSGGGGSGSGDGSCWSPPNNSAGHGDFGAFVTTAAADGVTTGRWRWAR